ncbi:crotonobetainyl-CoA:carnitine CoA-transferase CaiB-like acyl-CoA transferase [Sphingobium subterraneum]|uniref:Crotonobetainyl-CoA:carnitine CoA-transferase CaiB-like acyl-CoA transferase n=2 Tax=Sphingobium subterraneum TaxID=627688 RepID=A0A841IYL1_9SPHN|nr:crotonobetainyl-CoA:carnitine CoA-transferase CaiB-like acyl-CoA transferase [Sphingobium subterraneum]
MILDLTHVLAGPYATYQFALLGADVIKVENPTDPDCARGRGPSIDLAAEGRGLNYMVQAANKRALALDLKTKVGREAFLRLAERADVVVENYSPGVMDTLDLSADLLMKRNPRLIHCSINGFGGGAGSAQSLKAYDNVIQAASGNMAQTGKSGPPVKTGASMIDYFTGMSAAFAISAALHERAASGVGQHVQCAMFDCALALMAPEIAAHLFEGARRTVPSEAGLGTYDTADGQLMLGAFTPEQVRTLWRSLGEAEFVVEGWDDVWKSSPAMRERLTTIFATETASEWEARLNGVGIPAQRVRTLDEALADPALARPHFLKALRTHAGDVTVPLSPFTLERDGPTITAPPPRVGEHGEAILREHGFDESEIASLRSEGAIP